MTSEFEAQRIRYIESQRQKCQILDDDVLTPSSIPAPVVFDRLHEGSSLSTGNSQHVHIPHQDCCSNYCQCWKKPNFQQCFSLTHNSIEVLSIPLLGQGRVPLRIHYTWPAFILLSFLVSLRISPLFALFALVLGGPILFTTVLIHEVGHALMAISLGGRVSQILLWPLGGLAYMSFFGETNPKADALVAIAGPATHVPQILFWIILMAASNAGDVELNWRLAWGWNFWLSLCAGAIAMQISLFLFNLIPAYPLDGGRILAAFLASSNMNQNRAFQLTAMIGSVFGWYLFFGGLRSGSAGLGTPSLFSGLNRTAIGLFILFNCWQLWSRGTTGSAVEHPGYDRLTPTEASSSSSQPLIRSDTAGSTGTGSTGNSFVGRPQTLGSFPQYGDGSSSSESEPGNRNHSGGGGDVREAPVRSTNVSHLPSPTQQRFQGGHGVLGHSIQPAGGLTQSVPSNDSQAKVPHQ